MVTTARWMSTDCSPSPPPEWPCYAPLLLDDDDSCVCGPLGGCRTGSFRDDDAGDSATETRWRNCCSGVVDGGAGPTDELRFRRPRSGEIISSIDITDGLDWCEVPLVGAEPGSSCVDDDDSGTDGAVLEATILGS